ncbi:MAG: class I SAM-dependent methyltransferase [Saprospiraceae bacterium]
METLQRKASSETTRKLYRLIAPVYDLWSMLTERKALNRVLELAEIKDGENILEVACGTAWLFKKVVQRNPNGQNIAVDLSEDMINMARKKLASEKSANYELLAGDIFSMNLNKNNFDLILNNFMIDLLPEKDFRKIGELFYELLKPGGRVVIATFSFGDKKYHKFWYWLARNFPKLLTNCRPVNFKPYLKEIGFEITNCEFISQNTFPSEVIKAVKPL